MIFLTIILGVISCASVLVVSWWNYLLNFGLLFRFCFVNDGLYLVSSFLSFFSMKASSLLVLVFSSLSGLLQYSEVELLTKKFFFLLNTCIIFSFSLVQSVSYFLWCITNFNVSKMSSEVRYHFSVRYFSELFL